MVKLDGDYSQIVNEHSPVAVPSEVLKSTLTVWVVSPLFTIVMTKTLDSETV